MKFDVNKIITESILEEGASTPAMEARRAAGEASRNKVAEVKKVEPAKDDDGEGFFSRYRRESKLRKATNEGNVDEVRKINKDNADRIASNKLQAETNDAGKKLANETTRDAAKESTSNTVGRKTLTYGTKEYDRSEKEYVSAGSKEQMDKAVASEAAKKKALDDAAAAKSHAEAQSKFVADEKSDDTSVTGHLVRSVKKFKTNAEEKASEMGHKAAEWVGNLDPTHAATAGAAGIAAGLGALALRKRLKKVK